MSKLSKNAFAIMAMCENTKEPFGITVDPREGSYAFAWAFKIKRNKRREKVTTRPMFEEPLCLTKTSMAVLIVDRRTSISAIDAVK